MGEKKEDCELLLTSPDVYCIACNLTMSSVRGYKKHLKRHEPPGGFVCRFCDARYCSPKELKQHIDGEHTTIVCRMCRDITFSSEDEYREHIRVVHNGVDRQLFKCTICGMEYKTIGPYHRHIQTKCGKIKPFQCNQCPMSFVTKYNLKAHKTLHAGEKKFCCSFCGKNFFYKVRLTEHERTHTGEKPYKCDICGKGFAHRESIVTHSSLHTGVRLVECLGCNSRFSCYSNLIKHRRIRPETCGLPKFDPPKKGTRKTLSRIPATLYPKSEIKVASENKAYKVNKNKPPKLKEVTKPNDKKENCNEKAETKSNNDKMLEKENLPQKSSATKETIECTIKIEEDVNWFNEKDKILDSLLNNKTDNSKQQAKKTDLKDKEFHNDNETLNTPLEVCTVLIKNEIISDNELMDEMPLELTYLQPNVKDEAQEKPWQRTTRKKSSVLEKTEMVLLNSEHAINPLENVVTEMDCLEQAIKEEIEVEEWSNKESDVAENAEEFLIKSEIVTENQLKDVPVQLSNTKKKLRSDGKASSSQLNAKDDPLNIVKSKKSTKTKKKSSKVKRTAKTDNSEMWTCKFCKRKYRKTTPYKKHLLNDHECKETEIEEIIKQLEETMPKKLFNCQICQKTYAFEKRLTAHMELHGNNGSLQHKCPCKCSKFFATKEEATAHAQQEHSDLIFCKECNKFLSDIKSMKTHMRIRHEESACKRNNRIAKQQLICEKCGKKCFNKTLLSDHVRSDCGRKPSYGCTICGKQLTTAGILKTHMLLHKDETPYQCDKCGKTFKIKWQYKSHIKILHTDDQPFKCHLCSKAYRWRESLLVHMTKHTGIKRFACNCCGKRFTCVGNLQAHRRVNSESCGKTPLNAKATLYMGVKNGNLIVGQKPEYGSNFEETDNDNVATEQKA